MRTLQFNFNNDVNTFTIYEEEDGTIRVPLPGGDEATYANRQQFAEMYAQARDVTPDNLKNWKLVENGDVLSFICVPVQPVCLPQRFRSRWTRYLASCVRKAPFIRWM